MALVSSIIKSGIYHSAKLPLQVTSESRIQILITLVLRTTAALRYLIDLVNTATRLL